MLPLAIVRAASAAYAPIYLPFLIGGTSGIGRATQKLCSVHKREAHNILVGLNAAVAELILTSFPDPNPCSGNTIRLMRHETAVSLAACLPRVNFFILTQGYFSFVGRNETAEGLDSKLVLYYYLRWAFTAELLPVLRRAQEADDVRLWRGSTGKAAIDAGVTYKADAGEPPTPQFDEREIRCEPSRRVR
ncbi:hypothetical protein B0H19DRAFT_1224587 [Mycena capillaripes]|nr:hypothetical protein B0H19DRAFT_1224587 [Mycena capillaripes]